jgi:serine/threonine protein kinase
MSLHPVGPLWRLIALMTPVAVNREIYRSFLAGVPITRLLESLVADGYLTLYQAEESQQGRAELLFLGRCVLLNPVGVGGMGVVFRALDLKFQREVALKIVRNYRTGKKQLKRLKQRLKREAFIHGRLGPHPHLVCLYDTRVWRGRRYLVLEWVEGMNLQQIVEESGPLPWRTAVRIVRDVCRGLTFAARNGIVHRDVKPANIRVTPEGIGKLLDLGLAGLIHADDDRDDPTLANPILGTPGYIPPEVFVNGLSKDVRGDVFSAAATLYFAGTGRRPYEGDHPLDIVSRNAAGELPSMQGVPRRVARILRRAMDRDPARRYQHPRQLEVALHRLLRPRRNRRARSRTVQEPKRPGRALPMFLFVVFAVIQFILIMTMLREISGLRPGRPSGTVNQYPPLADPGQQRRGQGSHGQDPP